MSARCIFATDSRGKVVFVWNTGFYTICIFQFFSISNYNEAKKLMEKQGKVYYVYRYSYVIIVSLRA